MRMSHLYQSADVTTVTGAIGPLYYATVTIVGTPVWSLVDPGSSATIMSFKLFHKIGDAAHIPAYALQKPDIMLLCHLNSFTKLATLLISLLMHCKNQTSC